MSSPYFTIPPWTDLRTPLLSTRASGSNPPILDRLYNNGFSQGVYAYRFPYTSSEKEVYLSVQLPHGYLEGSDLHPHLHIVTKESATGTTKWGMEYNLSNINDFFPTTTTIITGSLSISSPVPNKHMILPFPVITGTNIKISSMMSIRVFRHGYNSSDPDSFNGDIYALEFDIHYQSDTVGSRAEFYK